MPWSAPIPLSSLTVGAWTALPDSGGLFLMRLDGQGILARLGPAPAPGSGGPTLLQTRVRASRVQALLPDWTSAEETWSELKAGLARGEGEHCVRALVAWIQQGHPVAALFLGMAGLNGGVVASVADALHLSRGQGGPALAQIAMGPLELLRTLPPQAPSPPPRPAGELALLDARLHTAAEALDAEALAGLLVGAGLAGWDRAHLEGALLGLCADHFLDHGQGLITVCRVFDLLEGTGAGPEQCAEVLAGVGRSLVHAHRSEAEPAWRPFRQALGRLDLAALHRASVTGAPAWFDRGALLRALLSGDPAFCLAEWIRAVQGGVPLPDLSEVLCLGAAQCLLRADLRHEYNPRQPVGWLELAQAFTHAQTLHELVPRWHDARVLRLLLFGVWQLARLSALNVPPKGLEEAQPGGAEGVLEAAALREPDRAVAIAQGLSRASLCQVVMRLGLDGQTALPHQSAHRVHAALAALRLSEELSTDEATLPLLGVLRYLSAPRQERRLRKELAGVWSSSLRSGD